MRNKGRSNQRFGVRQNNNAGEGQNSEQTERESSLRDAACYEIPVWAATEIRKTWAAARSVNGQLEAFRILERMVDRLGYGRTDGNPPLYSQNTQDHAPR